MKTTIEKTFSELTKVERKAIRLEQHYSNLQSLYDVCGGGKLNGKKLSLQLFKLEQEATKLTTAQCNGTGSRTAQDKRLNEIQNEVQSRFNGNLIGLFINGDPRGYALKINDEVMRSDYADLSLDKDWGGYGILSPEINGDY